MPDYSRQFYVEQLKAHLEYYRELGIDGLSLKMNPWSAPSIISSESRNSRSSVSEFHAKSEVGSEATRGVERLSLFETSVTDQVSKESLETIRTDLGDCRRCKLCSTRTNIVFGSGTPKAELVFVGEGPGADEDVQGLPFVGKAGQLLTKIIEAIQLKRDQVYICNVVKCRPPGNRFPEEDEIAACSPFLFRQLESIRPKVICCLGAAAAQTILRTKASIGKLRGQFHEYRGIKVIPTYHPSYLLRNPEAKRDVWEDMKKIRLLLNELG